MNQRNQGSAGGAREDGGESKTADAQHEALGSRVPWIYRIKEIEERDHILSAAISSETVTCYLGDARDARDASHRGMVVFPSFTLRTLSSPLLFFCPYI